MTTSPPLCSAGRHLRQPWEPRHRVGCQQAAQRQGARGCSARKPAPGADGQCLPGRPGGHALKQGAHVCMYVYYIRRRPLCCQTRLGERSELGKGKQAPGLSRSCNPCTFRCSPSSSPSLLLVVLLKEEEEEEEEGNLQNPNSASLTSPSLLQRLGDRAKPTCSPPLGSQGETPTPTTKAWKGEEGKNQKKKTTRRPP